MINAKSRRWLSLERRGIFREFTWSLTLPVILNILKDRNYAQILRLMKISVIGEFLILFIFLDVESIYNKGFSNSEGSQRPGRQRPITKEQEAAFWVELVNKSFMLIVMVVI